MTELKKILSNPHLKEDFYLGFKKRLKKQMEDSNLSPQDRAQYISGNLPLLQENIVKLADEALHGEFILPGTLGKLHFVGNPPDWFSNPLNDDEYVWSLNRMFHWKTLLQAYALTKDNRYAKKVVDELIDWSKRCIRPMIDKNSKEAYKSFYSADPWRSLEAGIRMYEVWPHIFYHLIDTEYFTPEFLEVIAVAFYEHGEVLAEICPIFWPRADHNHYLMENLGLLTVACMFPEFKKSQKWKNHAVKELERCAFAQLTTDGSQIEGSPSYHNGCVYWFCLSLIIAKYHEISFSPEYIERIKNSIDYSLYALRPSGTNVPFGDSDADLSAVKSSLFGYLAFGDIKWLKIIAQIIGADNLIRKCSEFIWSIPDFPQLTKQLDVSINQQVESLSLINVQREMNQVMFRSDWTSSALSVFFACHTPVNSGHAHIDPMSFDFTALGKPLIIDPGRYTYREDEDRRYFKSAAAHNTLTIDEKEPFEYISTWEFSSQKKGEITKVYENDRFNAAEAIHFNYEPAVHKRLVALVDSSILLVLDQVLDIDKASTVQIYFQINSTNVEWRPEGHYAKTEDSGTNIFIKACQNVNGEVLDGRISEYLDIYKPSKRLRLTSTSPNSSKRCFATVMVPFRHGCTLPEISDIYIEDKGYSIMYNFEYNGKPYSFSWGEDSFEMV